MNAGFRLRHVIAAGVAVAIACAHVLASGQEVTWTGGGSTRSWSNMDNWSSTWTAGPTVNLSIGSGFASGQPLQNITSSNVSGTTGVRIGTLTIAAPSPVALTGSRIFLNGNLSALGSGSHSITAPLSFQVATPNFNVADAGGILRLSTLSNASGSAATFTKTGAGDLVLTASLSGSQTIRLLEGTLTAGTSGVFGGNGNRLFTGPVLRLEGGTLRALGPESVPANLPPWISPATYFATVSVPVSPDVILSGSVTLGRGATPAENARLTFASGMRLDQESRLTVNNESTLMRHIEGAHRLTVAGTGRLVLSSLTSPADIPAQRPTELVVDGGAIGILNAVGLPGVVTLTNGGRLDTLQPLTLTGSQAVTIAGGGIIRNAGLGDMTLNADQLRGGGTLTVQSMLPTNLPPNLPPNFFIQPGRVRLNGANQQFTGNTLIDGGELVVTAVDSLGSTLVTGGTQAVTVRSGALFLSGSGSGGLLTPDLSRVVVERDGILRLGASTGFTVTPQTVPVAPVAGMISIVSGSLGGTGIVPVADGAAIQYAGGSTGTLQTGVRYTGTAPGTVTLAGAYIPNRGFSWGGVLNVTGTVTEQSSPVTLQISGAGVLLSGSQGHSGGTIVSNGRLDVQNTNAFGLNRSVLLSAGSQLDLRVSVTSTSQLPIIAPGSAGMIGLGSSGTPQVTNAVVQAMDRGLNSIGPAHSSGDYVYSLTSLPPGAGGVYRFGTVSTTTGSGAFLVPKAFKITQADVLTGSARVDVGMTKGPALGSGGSILTINANQTGAGPFTVLPDFFLASEQNLTHPFGTAGVALRGRLLATGSQGSFVNLQSPITFQRGAELWLDYATGTNVDRWSNSRSIPLNAGALRLRGNVNTTFSIAETVGTLEYSGRSRISLDQANASSSNVMSLTLAGLSPSASGNPSLEILKVRGTEKVIVTAAPALVGAANLVHGVYDVRNNDFVTWNGGTQELIQATPTHTNSFFSADQGSFVNVTTTMSVSGPVTALALRTAATINRSGSAALVIGNGTSGMLIARGPTPAYTTLTIAPDLAFSGAGQIYVAPNTYVNLTGVLDAPNGLVKLGAGDLHLRGGLAAGGGRSIRLREGRLLGSGTFAGWSIIAEGNGTLAPGDSPGVAEVDSLESNGETPWEFELQALDNPDLVSDKWIVTGDLILNGFVDVINWVDPAAPAGTVGTMQEGIYELISWGGSLSGDGLELRTMPEGFFGQLTIDEVRKVVELQVSLTGSFVAVPEPSAWVLALSAAVACGFVRRRRTGRLDGFRAGRRTERGT